VEGGSKGGTAPAGAWGQRAALGLLNAIGDKPGPRGAVEVVSLSSQRRSDARIPPPWGSTPSSVGPGATASPPPSPPWNPEPCQVKLRAPQRRPGPAGEARGGEGGGGPAEVQDPHV